ncbi:MAG: hypothetical protein ABSF37_07970 [Sedimentisphaerales bacterium]|jgi:hypothetical protein
MKTSSAYKTLGDKDKQFLSDIAKQVAMLVAEPQKMGYFRKQLSEFADKWTAYEATKGAERKGKWQPSMGRPSNPLWAIWPRNAGASSFPDFGDIPPVLGGYAILAAIHDNVLPHCPLIAKGIMPKELFNKIWRDLVTGANEECRALPIITPDKIMVIPITKVENFLQNVTDDIKSHFPSKKSATQKLVAIANLASTKAAETQISPIDTVVNVLDDCIGRIHNWFECKGIRPEYLILNARNEAIKIQEKLNGIGTPAGEPDFAKDLEEIRRRLSDYKNEQIKQRLRVIEQRVIDVLTFTNYPNASPPSALLGNMKEELEGLRADLVCWTGEKNQADLASIKPAETKHKATPTTIININKLGVLGDIQKVETLQTGDNAHAYRHMKGKEGEKGILEPKPPEFLQKLLWVLKHGRNHWKLILLAAIILLFLAAITSFFVPYINSRIRSDVNPPTRIQALPQPQKPHRNSVEPTHILKEPVISKQQLIGIPDLVNEPNKGGRDTNNSNK